MVFWFIFGLGVGLLAGYVFGISVVYGRLRKKYPKVYELMVWKESVK